MSDYIWQPQFQAALFETDTVLMQDHIKKAREIIVKRLKVLAIHKYSPAKAEYQAIDDAERQLKALERQAK